MTENKTSLLTEKQKNILKQEIPEKQISITPDKFKYVSSPIIIAILNKAFDYVWNWEILDQKIEPCVPYPKHPQIEGSYAWVKGRLHYPFKNGDKYDWAFKDAIGGKVIVGQAKVQSQVFKSASTDALKKAASLLGIAPNVYMSDELYTLLQEEALSEDTWNTMELNRHANAIKRINQYKDIIGEIALNDKKIEFCDEVGAYTVRGEITPSNVEEFAEYLDYTVKPIDTASQMKVSSNPFDRVS